MRPKQKIVFTEIMPDREAAINFVNQRIDTTPLGADMINDAILPTEEETVLIDISEFQKTLDLMIEITVPCTLDTCDISMRKRHLGFPATSSTIMPAARTLPPCAFGHDITRLDQRFSNRYFPSYNSTLGS